MRNIWYSGIVQIQQDRGSGEYLCRTTLLASLLEQQAIHAKQQRESKPAPLPIHFKLSACSKRAETNARASKELTAVQTNYLQYIFQAINTLLTQNLGFFDAMGQNLFRSFATILTGRLYLC